MSLGVIHDRANGPTLARHSEVVNNSAASENSPGGRPASIVFFMELKCRGEISPAARRRLNSASTRPHSSIAAMLLARRSKWATKKSYGLSNRFSVGSQPLGGGDGLYPVYRREGDLRAVGLNLRIAIRSSSFRLFLRFKPKLDSLLAGKTGDVPVPVSKRFFAIFYREEEGRWRGIRRISLAKNPPPANEPLAN